MTTDNNRVLIVDDNASIHQDFEKILLAQSVHAETAALDELIDSFLNDDGQNVSAPPVAAISYELTHAYQGQEALAKISANDEAGKPFALVFMDVRMPPGWDGIESIQRIWQEHPHVEMVICTAFSDYSWEEILAQLGSSDQLQFLRKPFDTISIKQMALALTKKWNLAKRARDYVEDLERDVALRTAELAQKVDELESAMREIKQLQDILPMCAYCHKIRDDEGFWHRVDQYLHSHTLSSVSHGVCPECYGKLMAPLVEDAEN